LETAIQLMFAVWLGSAVVLLMALVVIGGRGENLDPNDWKRCAVPLGGVSARGVLLG